MLEVVVLLIPSTEVPSPSLVIENKVFGSFSSAAKGNVRLPPPPPAAGAHAAPFQRRNWLSAGATLLTGLPCNCATNGLGYAPLRSPPAAPVGGNAAGMTPGASLGKVMEPSIASAVVTAFGAMVGLGYVPARLPPAAPPGGSTTPGASFACVTDASAIFGVVTAASIILLVVTAVFGQLDGYNAAIGKFCSAHCTINQLRCSNGSGSNFIHRNSAVHDLNGVDGIRRQ